MKFSTVLLTAAALLASNQSFARHGGETDNRPDRPARGTQAWFVQESGEHEIRALLAAGTITEASVSSLLVTLTAPTLSDVVVGNSGGELSDTCEMKDHWSRRGTVLKKEVYCGNAPYYAPSVETNRGTNAWALVEGIEHAVRSEFRANASIASKLISASSAIEGNKVAVELYLADGTELSFLCSRFSSSSNSNSIVRADLNCIRM